MAQKNLLCLKTSTNGWNGPGKNWLWNKLKFNNKMACSPLNTTINHWWRCGEIKHMAKNGRKIHTSPKKWSRNKICWPLHGGQTITVHSGKWTVITSTWMCEWVDGCQLQQKGWTYKVHIVSQIARSHRKHRIESEENAKCQGMRMICCRPNIYIFPKVFDLTVS